MRPHSTQWVQPSLLCSPKPCTAVALCTPGCAHEAKSLRGRRMLCTGLGPGWLCWGRACSEAACPEHTMGASHICRLWHRHWQHIQSALLA